MIYLVVYLLFLTPLCADDWKGGEYAKNSCVQLSQAEQLLFKYLSLKEDDSILDLGCGDGKVTALLAQKVPLGKVIGIDPSDSMLEKAKMTYPDLYFASGRAEDFTSEELFDHIITIHVMHWVKEQEKALVNIRNHLKPNGRIHFIIAPSKEGLPYYAALQKTLAKWRAHFEGFVNPQAVYDMETYRKLLVQAGFHIYGIHYVYREVVFETEAKLKNWIKQWNPYVKHLPFDLQDTFLDELIQNFDASVDPLQWGEYVLFVEAGKPL